MAISRLCSVLLKKFKVETLDISNLKQSVALTTGNDIAQICQCINDAFGITYFSYVKAYEDGTHFCIANTPSWLELFYSKLLDKTCAFARGSNLYGSGNVLWTTLNQQHIYGPAKEYFNIDNGITLIRQTKEACDFYCFGSKPDNHTIINFYLNNLDILQHFILYFREKGKSIIEKAELDRQILPVFQRNLPKQLDYTFEVAPQIRAKFLADLSLEQYILANVYLTKRETQCLWLLSKGQTAKDIGKRLGISNRTVETHLQHLKTKTNLARKSDLVSFATLEQNYQVLSQYSHA
ncbi:MAG: hypothetical protein K0S11_1548, partial [Gammaproteobacteria bacterium]|nr:hypothetical protein [Gammaproteobacteria bacterium]